MTAAERLRSFIAIELSQEVKLALEELQHTLRTRIPSARWVKPDMIHLTVKFLGDVPQSKLTRLADEMNSWVGKIPSLSLQPEGIGAFPALKNPRVLWVGFRSQPGHYLEIVETLSAGLVSFGFPRESRPHVPHLTLARFRNPGDAGDLRLALDSVASFSFPSFAVSHLTLFRSDLDSRGAIYKRLSQASLA